MMRNETLETFLNELKQKGLKISLDGENLSLNSPKGLLNKEAMEKLAFYKQDIIAILKNERLQRPELKTESRKNTSPLSFPQQRLWFLEQFLKQKETYNITTAFHIKGRPEIPALKQAFEEIINRHEILRTNFAYQDGQPVQVIKEKAELPFTITEVQNIAAAKNLVSEEAAQTFDLSRDTLLKVLLLKIDQENYVLGIIIHHIIADAWSCGVIAGELAVLYKAFSGAESYTLPELKVQYADYAIWQRKMLKGPYLENQLEYWKKALKGSPSSIELPFDFKRPDKQGFAGNEVHKALEPALVKNLKGLARSKATTPFVLFMSAFLALLSRYTGQKDINIGFPVAGRHHKGLENLVGFFVNTLVMRGEMEDNPDFSSFLAQTHNKTIEAFSYQDIPFEKLVEELSTERNLKHHPLFQVMFVMQNIEAEVPYFSGLEMQMLEINNKTAKFDLTLTVKDDCNNLSIEYNTGLLREETAVNMLNSFATILEDIVREPGKKLSELEVIPAAEKNTVLNQWNKPERLALKYFSLPAAIGAIAEFTPDKTALVFEKMEITYKGLDERSNRLANYLLKKGVKKGAKIALCIEPCIEMVIALLAILKTGAAYVPLDPGLPSERLTFIIEDCQPGFILAENSLKNFIIPVIVFAEEEAVIAQESPASPDIKISPDDLAYIIYTSGSTGKPNGVCVTHSNVLRLFPATEKYFDFDNNDTWVLFHSFAFDYSVWEIWGCLYWGGKLLIIPKSLTRLPEEFYKKICEEKVTVLNQTPSAFYNFSRTAVKSGLKNSLRWIVLSGEALDIELTRDWFEKFPENSPRLVNMYGITETTVFVTFYLLGKADSDNSARSPIGVPLPDLTCYVLDENRQPVPRGVKGELHVGGDGVSNGYLNRPELNLKRFPDNPYGPGKLYKTGDLVRMLPDNSLEYFGRIDLQVKIRGHRIETGEIEYALNQYEAVKESAVKMFTDDKKGNYLAAYIVWNDDIKAGQELPLLRAFLKNKLSEPMIPAFFITMKDFPLTNNGKTDRKALPAPEITNIVTASEYAPPVSELETIIADTFRELTGIGKIGLYDNFFETGAHSLLMVDARMKIQQKTGLNFDLVDLFSYPTIKSFAGFLSGEDKAGKEKSKPSGAAATDGIAVIGMSGRFPGAKSAAELWQNLSDGKETVHFFSDEELKKAGVSEELLKNPKYVKANAILDEMDCFDAAFFGYTPREAEIMDPQHRIFLECAYEALENSGYINNTEDYSIGVYAGTGISRYLLFNISQNQDLIEKNGYFQLLLANDKDYLATRAAYRLNLKGPVVTVQTACSTSLSAVHLACRSIIADECDIALAGGVTIDTQGTGYLYQEGAIASPDGHCRPFDEKGQGIVGGSGVGIVVLKKLSQAEKDGDYIYAVIKGSAMNNDGSDKVGFMAPGIRGQAEVIEEALIKSGVEAESISYIETHGTATTIGDPIEIRALTRAFKSFTAKKQFCAIGSVKSNIGHLDAAAGITGFIKTVLALKNRKIPPTLHYQKPNPQIDFINSPFFVNTELKDWKNEKYPLRAGVSSFGVGGTNVHVVLEEYSIRNEPDRSHKPELLVLSAKTEASLEIMAENLRNYLSANEVNLSDAAFTLQNCRREFGYRMFMVVSRSGQGNEEGNEERNGQARSVQARSEQKILNSSSIIHNQSLSSPVFLFPGLGTQYPGMGTKLYSYEEVFRQEIDKCQELLQPYLEKPLTTYLFSDDSRELMKPSVMQPAIFSIEYALARLWISRGIKPAALLGHSFGEYAALCIAGACTLEEIIPFIAFRGLLFEKTGGAMLSVLCNEDKINRYLSKEVSIAAYNAPELVMLAGETEILNKIHEELKADKIASRFLDIPHATHCQLVEPLIGPLVEKAEEVNWKNPEIPVISNVTGEWFSTSGAINPEYFGRHLREPVRFSDGLKRLSELKEPLLLETGPGKTLYTLAGRNKFKVITSMASAKEEYISFLTAFGTLWQKGCNINRCGHGQKIPLPGYAFEKQSYWIEPLINKPVKQALKKLGNTDDWFYIPSWKRTLPAATPLKQVKNWLVFINDDALSSSVLEILAKQGQNIFAVSKGSSSFWTLSHTIASGNQEEYSSLFSALEEKSFLPDNILHLWNYSEEGSVTDSFYSLMFLVQALGKTFPNQKVTMGVIADKLHDITGSEVIHPEKALITGLLNIIPHEYENINCFCLDIDSEKHFETIISEFNTPVSRVNALRGKYKWQRIFEKYRPETRPDSLLKKGGCYIITGGTGGMGQTFAGLLSEKYEAKLVLVSRTIREVSGDKNILAVKADVSQSEQLRKVFEKAVEQFGKIDGIIHTAGIQASGFIFNKTVKEAESVFAAKIAGTILLAQLAEEFGTEFLLLCSSLGGILGGAGQADYSAAGSFMDAFAASGNSEKLKVISLDWGTWNKAGMAVKALENLPPGIRAIQEKMLNEGIMPEEGNQVLETVMKSASDTPNLLVSSVPLAELQVFYNQKPDLTLPVKPKTNLYSRPEMVTGYKEPQNETEKIIAEIWQENLGIDKIGTEDNFFELGGHSLLAVSMKEQLEKRLGEVLPLSVLFEGETISELARAVNRQKNDKVLVKLKSGAKRNFFCIHAISGTVFPFSALASALNHETAFYGIQAPGLTEGTEPLETIEEMAERYIRAIKTIQESGPYLIGGWSFGGLVAVETARKLKKQGEQVGLLAIIDMAAPVAEYRSELNDEIIRERFTIDMRGLFGPEHNLSFEDPQISSLYKVFKAGMKAAAGYKLENYSGKITLFRAENGLFPGSESVSLGWHQISETEVYKIPGDHYTVLKSPELGALLNNFIEKGNL